LARVGKIIGAANGTSAIAAAQPFDDIAALARSDSVDETDIVALRPVLGPFALM